MQRYLLVILVLASLAVGATAAQSSAGRSAAPTVAAKKCKKGYTHAVIAKKHACLTVGVRCRTSLDRQYHRAKLHLARKVRREGVA